MSLGKAQDTLAFFETKKDTKKDIKKLVEKIEHQLTPTDREHITELLLQNSNVKYSKNNNGTWFRADQFEPEMITTLENFVNICLENRGTLEQHLDYEKKRNKELKTYETDVNLVKNSQGAMISVKIDLNASINLFLNTSVGRFFISSISVTSDIGST